MDMWPYELAHVIPDEYGVHYAGVRRRAGGDAGGAGAAARAPVAGDRPRLRAAARPAAGPGAHLGSAGLLQGSAAVRLARAAALRAVCAQDAARGAQLLEGVEVRIMFWWLHCALLSV